MPSLFRRFKAAVTAGRLRPDRLVTRRITLAQAGTALAAMSDAQIAPGAPGAGVTVVEPFGTGETG